MIENKVTRMVRAPFLEMVWMITSIRRLACPYKSALLKLLKKYPGGSLSGVIKVKLY